DHLRQTGRQNVVAQTLDIARQSILGQEASDKQRVQVVNELSASFDGLNTSITNAFASKNLDALTQAQQTINNFLTQNSSNSALSEFNENLRLVSEGISQYVAATTQLQTAREAAITADELQSSIGQLVDILPNASIQLIAIQNGFTDQVPAALSAEQKIEAYKAQILSMTDAQR